MTGPPVLQRVRVRGSVLSFSDMIAIAIAVALGIIGAGVILFIIGAIFGALGLFAALAGSAT